MALIGTKQRDHRSDRVQQGLNFWILLVVVFGRGPKITARGALSCARWSRQSAIMSSAVGGCTSSEDLAYGEAEQLDARGSKAMPKSRDNATVEFAMTLSTLAYVDENRTATQQQMINEINAGLEQAGYEGWQVVWGPALNVDRSNLAYAAGNGQTGQLAISIRGSDFSFWLNWIEDLAGVRQVPYDQFVSNASGQIAFGTAIGLRQVLGMRDGTTSLETFLTAAPEGTPVLLTGHSLGGCLASAFAPCVANWMSRAASISVYTIAAPSPGNADFADYYNALFTDPSGHSTAFRFFNSLDVVPNAWASLDTIETYYPPLVSCPPDISKIAYFPATAFSARATRVVSRKSRYARRTCPTFHVASRYTLK